MDNKCCENCRFSRPDPWVTSDDELTCHFDPPIGISELRGTMWPIVRKTDWCGKYNHRTFSDD